MSTGQSAAPPADVRSNSSVVRNPNRAELTPVSLLEQHRIRLQDTLTRLNKATTDARAIADKVFGYQTPSHDAEKTNKINSSSHAQALDDVTIGINEEITNLFDQLSRLEKL